jgi:hypothetical protein
MEGAWFTGVADELARCLTDAETCAVACEAVLESVRELQDSRERRLVVSALVAPAAISRVLIDLIDEPAQIVLAAARLCRESAERAIRELEPLDDQIGMAGALPALRAASHSCTALLEAAS